MSGDSWSVYDKVSYQAFMAHVRHQVEDGKYLTFAPPRIGRERSLDQNALFHVWITEYAAHLLRINTQDVDEGVKVGMKRTIKARFLHQNPECKGFMVIDVTCPLTGQTKKDYRSSSKYKKGEMFLLLTWLQMHAANDGLILESKGRFLQLQEAQKV